MIKEFIDIDSTKAAFLRAAGGESSSPVVTPNGLADFGVTFLSNLMAMIKPRLATGGQEYGLASEYAKRVGRSLNTVKDWLRNLYKPGGDSMLPTIANFV